jgi:hypothetical protein
MPLPRDFDVAVSKAAMPPVRRAEYYVSRYDLAKSLRTDFDPGGCWLPFRVRRIPRRKGPK